MHLSLSALVVDDSEVDHAHVVVIVAVVHDSAPLTRVASWDVAITSFALLRVRV